jgi:hypothetical protein
LACELLIQSAAPPDCTGGWLLDQLESIAMAPRIALLTVSAGGEAFSRMRIPIFPYLSILFGVGAFVSLSLLTNKRSATAGQRLERVTLPAQHIQGMNRPI